MTIHERVQSELDAANRQLVLLKSEIQRTASDIGSHIEDDAYGMTPGLGTQHAALQMAILGTRCRELKYRIEMLKYILRDDGKEVVDE